MKLRFCTHSCIYAGLIVLCLSLLTNGSYAEKVTYSDSWGNHGVSLTQQSPNGVSLNFSIREFSFEDRLINGEMMKEIGLTGNLLQNDEGAPNLPSISHYMAIPNGAKARVEIVSMRTESYQGIEMAPAPHIPLDTDRGPLQYNKNMNIYGKNAFYPAQPVLLSENGKLRGVDVVLINVTPYQYNPITKELIVYRDLQINVTFVGGTGEFGETRLRNRYWDPILKDHILNAQSLPVIDYSAQTASRANSDDTGFEYLIIVPNDPVFKKWADTIRNFRMEQGILTGIVTLQQIGGNTSGIIENYINNAYNTWDIPPVAILMMADYGTDANNSITSPVWDNYCVSDNIYADVDNDDMPDIVLARMTANNEPQLKVMVEKFKGYEMQPPTSPDFYNHPITALGWQTERWFQICSETIGGFFKYQQGKDPVRINEIYSGTPGNLWSTAANTNVVVDYFGPNGLQYIPGSPSSMGGWSGGNAADVNNALNAGAFILQHRDHGMETGWGEPSYTNTNINGLTNVGKLSYIMSVNCLTGKYNWSSECFAEKFHRYTYNNQNAGCVGILAASETSYSFVNDTYVWGFYDNLWPNFMPGYGAMYEERGVLPAFGNCAGKYFLQQSSWPSNTGNKEVTYHLFHHHGDAFLTLFSEVPQQLTVNHPAIMMSNATSFNVTANEGSFIALTYNNQIIGTATGTGLPAAVPVSGLLPIGATVKVVVTKQNYYRHYSNFLVISPDNPYVITESYTVNDLTGNNNNHLDTGEEAFLSLTERNLGNVTSLNTIVTLQLADPYITFLDNTEDYDTVPGQQTKTIQDGFRVQIANNVPNMHAVMATATATNGVDYWTSYIMLECWAPALSVSTLIIDDSQGGNGNGRLDPGESAIIKINTNNSGLSIAYNTIGSLTLTSGFLTLSNTSYAIGNINPLGIGQAIFNVTVNPAAPAGLPVDLIFSAVSGEYTAQKTFNIQVGLIVEDWETGDFSKFPWTFGGNQPWAITNIGPYEGTYSAKSGVINNSSSSHLIIQYDIPTNDSIRFTCKVSSEQGKDFLKFYIDNVLKEAWSGNVNWTKVSIPISAGIHTMKWIYSKDGTGTGGNDCAWLDYIIFPVPLVTTSYAGGDDYVCNNSTYQCSGNAANYTTISWSTSGTGSFSNPAILNPLYTPSSNDIAAGAVTLTLSVTGVSGTSTDDMILNILQPSTANAGANAAICEDNTFQLSAATASNYSAVAWTTSGTGTFDDQHALQPVYTPGEQDAITGAVTLTLTASNQACDPVSSTMSLTVHALPQPQITGAGELCEQTQSQVYSAPLTGNTCVWSVNGGEIISGNGTHEITVNWGTSGSGWVGLTETSPFSCTTSVTYPVILNALPVPQISGELTVCAGNSSNYSTLLIDGHSYLWEVTGATITSGQNSNEATINWETAGDYTVKVTETIDATQCSSVVEGVVTVNMLPVIPSKPSGSAEVDLNLVGTSEYATTGPQTLTYTWQVLPSEAGTINGNNTTATVTWNADYRGNATVSVKTSNECGESPWSEVITTRVFSSLGIADPETVSGILISPNPNNGEFQLTIALPSLTSISYRIIDSEGRLVHEKSGVPFKGTWQETLNLNISAGTYSIIVESATGNVTRKFVVK